MEDIKFSLRGVTVEQFATVFEPENDKIELNLSIPVKTNYDNRSLAVGANIRYINDRKPFMIVEAFCHYEIEEECWSDISEGCTKDVVLPKELMDTFVRIAVGAIRGIICVKTENTPFAKYYLPLIEISPSQEEGDFVIIKK
ncbi:MAG: hypothetical protein K2J63_01390 [Muribaculaceae bacterium]|nr:hypothetical protein [Muribaculaceae bacterium]